MLGTLWVHYRAFSNFLNKDSDELLHKVQRQGGVTLKIDASFSRVVQSRPPVGP